MIDDQRIFYCHLRFGGIHFDFYISDWARPNSKSARSTCFSNILLVHGMNPKILTFEHPEPQRARKVKKLQAKKNSWNQINPIFFREIAFLAVLNFFPVQKLIFSHFLNCKKWKLAKKNFVKLIYLISRVFFGLDFF